MPVDAHLIALEFEHALRELELSKDVSPLVSLFSESANLGNLGAAHGLRGHNGAREFWKRYLEQFSDIHSEFSQTIAADSTAVMEWESKGTLADGRPITYRGVSILRLDADGKVEEFQTYYDSAAFVSPTAGNTRAS